MMKEVKDAASLDNIQPNWQYHKELNPIYIFITLNKLLLCKSGDTQLPSHTQNILIGNKS